MKGYMHVFTSVFRILAFVTATARGIKTLLRIGAFYCGITPRESRKNSCP